MIVFIVGCDRSGTHWLARTLLKHPRITGTLEQMPQFAFSMGIAFRPELEESLLPEMIKVYREHERKARRQGKIFLDKAHMNTWIVLELKEAFPSALFIATRRNVFSTVASMRNHGAIWSDVVARCACMSWPNYYMGAYDLFQYMSEPLYTRFVRKWIAHDTYIRQLEAAGIVHVWDYDECAANPAMEFLNVYDHIGLEMPLEPMKRYDNLRVAAETLSFEDIEHIKQACKALEVKKC